MWHWTATRVGFLATLVLAAELPWAALEACGGYLDLDELANRAVSDQLQVSRQAISTLRMLGPRGLEALVAANRTAIERYAASPNHTEPGWPRISAALDAVAGQKDAWASGLYWYTDLEQAVSAAKKAKKPILSLRLLGRLDEEFSCANSRFFRTVLYPNAEVRKRLSEGFVLHWQSHRPVPRLTIDFGDGRKIERTITGNSAHYLLTPDGRVVDAIPGLYGLAAFLRELEGARKLVQRHASGDFDAVPPAAGSGAGRLGGRSAAGESCGRARRRPGIARCLPHRRTIGPRRPSRSFTRTKPGWTRAAGR